MADAELDIDRLAVVIGHREHRLLLAVGRLEMPERAVIGVMLERHGPLLGKIISNALGRREIERADAGEGHVDDRVEDEIERAESCADDRPDLGIDALARPVPRVIAQLEIDGVEEAALGRARHGDERAQLAAVDEEAPAAGHRIERQIHAELEPIVDAIGVFRHAVQRMVRHDGAGKGRLLAADRRVIVVQRHAERAGRVDLAGIDLDLVRLRPRRRRGDEQPEQRGGQGKRQRSRHHGRSSWLQRTPHPTLPLKGGGGIGCCGCAASMRRSKRPCFRK